MVLALDDGEFLFYHNTTQNSHEVRNCAGLHFAEQALFIAIATMLWATEIKAPVDENGDPILPDSTALLDTGMVV
jgi:hypothetical protein